MNIIDIISQNSQIVKWQQNLHQSTRQLLTGLSGTTKALAIASAFEQIDGKLVIVTATQNEAEKLVDELASILGSDYLYNFFTDDNPVAEFVFTSKDRTQSRIETLNFLSDKKKTGILVLNIASFRVLLPSKDSYQTASSVLNVNQEVELSELVKKLQQVGYKKVSRVLSQGEYSQRGDILDIFEINSEQPYRIEFFGDEIDGIRLFDVEKQTSLQNIDKVVISPASEIILREDEFSRATNRLEKAMQHATNDL